MSSASATRPASSRSEVLGFLTSRLRQIGIFLALIVIVLLFQVLTDGRLLTAGNVSNIIVQNSYILILAIGMVMIIIAGHIDLSVGSVAAFVGAMTGVMTQDWGMPWWAAILLGLLVGALVGIWQGFWVAYIGIPAFIVTLAGMLLFRGLTQIVLGNTQITPFPTEYRQLGGGYLFPQLSRRRPRPPSGSRSASACSRSSCSSPRSSRAASSARR